MFVVVGLILGLSAISVKQEAIFLGSMVIIVLLMGQILKDLSPVKRREIISLALSASHLGTKYLNKIFVIERGQYNELGILMISVALIGLTLPIATVVFFNPTNGLAWKKFVHRPRAKFPGYHYP